MATALRSRLGVRAARAIRQPVSVPASPARPAASRPFSASPKLPAGHPAYDPPTGNLFGVKPGEKYEKEGWENIFIFGYGGSILFLFIAVAFKPDTSINTWALEEAQRRLEAAGILPDPFPTPPSQPPNTTQQPGQLSDAGKKP